MGSVRFLPCRVILDGHFAVKVLTGLEIIALALGRSRGLIPGLRGLGGGPRGVQFGHVAGEATLHDPAHDIRIVALEDDKLERAELPWLVIVRRDLRILLVRLLPSLHEPLPLFFELRVQIRQLLGWEFAEELAHKFFLVIFEVFSLLLGRSQIHL